MERNPEKLAEIIERSLNLYGKYQLGSNDENYLNLVNGKLNLEHNFLIDDKGLEAPPRYQGVFTINREDSENA